MRTALLRRRPILRRPTRKHLLRPLRRRPGRPRSSTTPPSSPLICLRVFLRVDLLHRLLNLTRFQHLHLLPRRHNRDLDVFRAGLHDLEEGFDGKFDGGVAVERGRVVAFEEFADGFRGAADGVGFPVKKWLDQFHRV